MSARPGGARRGAAGFTLLEVLVALVVLGFLLAGLSQATHFGLLASGRQSAQIEQHAGLESVDRLLRQLVSQIDPGNRHDAPVMRGTESSVTFTSDLPAFADLPIHHAQMRLLVDGAHRLVLRWAPAPHVTPIGPPPAPTDTVLLAGVERLQLAYWPRPGNGAPGWRVQWNETTPPDLIRIRIVFVRGDDRSWPDIVAAVMRERP